jgi:putative endonuclease
MAASSPRRSERRQVGDDAEERAARLLRAAGLEILHRNYRCRLGELDIVAREGSTLVVAEVRLRSTSRFGGAAASITPAKRRRIVLATRHLLARYPSLQRWPLRFDAVLVAAAHGPIEWLRSAFDA